MVKKRFTIALLGIDGSGKSTIGKELKKWLITRGYRVKLVPFHHWLFADKLKRKTWKAIDTDRPRFDRPYEPKRKSLAALIKPIVALTDNIFFYIHNLPDGKKYNIVIFDRFICATQIKLKALNYRNNWIKPIWWNIKPDFAVIFDIPENISIERQKKRRDPYLYTSAQLSKEKKLYRKFSTKHDFLFIKNEQNKKTTLEIIKKELKMCEFI